MLQSAVQLIIGVAKLVGGFVIGLGPDLIYVIPAFLILCMVLALINTYKGK